MAMRWRVTSSEWQPNMVKTMSREGAKQVDEQDNRRRLHAYELNAQIGTRGCWMFMDSLSKDIEKQARHVGVWPRWRACMKQLRNMQMKMLDHVSLEQLMSIKNNTQRMRISMSPENLPGDTENIIQPTKEHNRLCWAALAYCNMHCDGSAACQSKCKIKKLLDNSPSIQDGDFQQLVPHLCPYNMADIDWDEIREA